MIYLLFEYLRSDLEIKLPLVFSYYSTRMILSALTALVISIFLGPLFIRKLYELKIGQSIRTEECPLLGQLHHKKKDTPTMGGILILFAMLASLVLWMDLRHIFTLILLLTLLFLGFVGGRDDYLKLKYKNTKGMPGKQKLFFQIIFGMIISGYLLIPGVAEKLHYGNWFQPPVVKEHISTAVQENLEGSLKTLTLNEYAGRIYIPFYKEPLFAFSSFFGLLFVALFIICVITGSSNAVNLTDGLDGLAAGCLIMVASSLALFAFISNHLLLASYLNVLYIEGSGEIAIFLSAFCGACLGFLWYNGHPAQVFMGDIGSLSLGGIIGVSAVLLKREFLLAIIGGIFVAEAFSVILQVLSYKFRNKRRIFLCSPLHHHYEYLGYPETKIVLRFWIVGLLLAIVGIASLKFQ